MQQLPELPYCTMEEGGNDSDEEGTEITVSSNVSVEKYSITPEKAEEEEEEGNNNLMEPPSPVVSQEVKQQQRKSTPRPPRRSPRLARMNHNNVRPKTPSPIKRHMEELLND